MRYFGIENHKVQLRRLLIGSAVVCALSFAAPVQATASTALNDQLIAEAIEDEFLYDMAVRSTAIDVTSQEGVITLNGVTNNILEKERAARIAQTVKGVRAVVNNVKVRPIGKKTGEQLKSDVVVALADDPATDSYEITVMADDAGKVILSGTVDSWQEKSLSETVAKGVAGVTEVNNNLKISYSDRRRPDPEIRSDIEGQLFWSVLVDSGLIVVDVDGGKVKLSGTVGSASERAQAEHFAYTMGVVEVDISELKVQDWARDPDRRSTTYTKKTDKEVAEAVRSALLYDPRVKLFDVDVAVSDGVTTLRGRVGNLAAKRAAEQDARNTLGVYSIRNRIKVKTSKIDADDKVADRVKKALTRDPYVTGHDVSVVVNGGGVKLYGTVDTLFEKTRADYVAEHAKGVVSVNNNLAVRNNDRLALVYDPYVTYYPLYLYDWYDYTPFVSFESDREIREQIKDELAWSPFVDADDVTVAVVGGKAVLTGKVDSLSEFRAATENAWEGGATWVVNDLKISRDES